jgi:hypothetical protein
MSSLVGHALNTARLLLASAGHDSRLAHPTDARSALNDVLLPDLAGIVAGYAGGVVELLRSLAEGISTSRSVRDVAIARDPILEVLDPAPESDGRPCSGCARPLGPPNLFNPTVARSRCTISQVWCCLWHLHCTQHMNNNTACTGGTSHTLVARLQAFDPTSGFWSNDRELPAAPDPLPELASDSEDEAAESGQLVSDSDASEPGSDSDSGDDDGGDGDSVMPQTGEQAEDCAICFNPLNDCSVSSRVSLLPCRHDVFHRHCIERHHRAERMRRGRSRASRFLCPVCRQEVASVLSVAQTRDPPSVPAAPRPASPATGEPEPLVAAAPQAVPASANSLSPSAPPAAPPFPLPGIDSAAVSTSPNVVPPAAPGDPVPPAPPVPVEYPLARCPLCGDGPFRRPAALGSHLRRAHMPLAAAVTSALPSLGLSLCQVCRTPYRGLASHQAVRANGRGHNPCSPVRPRNPARRNVG